MSNVLIVPEKNEGQRPLPVIEEGLKAASVDEVLVVDGWSTDALTAAASFCQEMEAEGRVPVLFRNHGWGASLSHFHWQVGALTRIPRRIYRGHARENGAGAINSSPLIPT